MRQKHPAWRLLTADHVPLIVSFLHEAFVRPNVRTLSQPDLASRLDDYLYSLRADLGEEAFPREALLSRNLGVRRTSLAAQILSHRQRHTSFRYHSSNRKGHRLALKPQSATVRWN